VINSQNSTINELRDNNNILKNKLSKNADAGRIRKKNVQSTTTSPNMSPERARSERASTDRIKQRKNLSNNIKYTNKGFVKKEINKEKENSVKNIV